MPRDIAVVGAGLTGLVLAWRLGQQGHTVTVFEPQAQVGGLSTWESYGEFDWDRFYHVILPSDRHLIALIRELGLGDQLHWQRTYTGYFVNRQLYSISSNLEFLRFPPLTLWNKFRLAWTMWYGSKINDWRTLEKISVRDWLVKVSGPDNYEKLWKPLLLAKLGSAHERVSAVFIWAYIKRMFSARDKTASAEHLGYVGGGYKAVLTALLQAIEAQGGRVHTGSAVEQIGSDANRALSLTGPDGTRSFDEVILTCPTSVLPKLVDPALLQVTPGHGEVEYLGVVCVILVTDKPIVPYYVVNIADSKVPFTGVIGMSSVIGTEHTAGKHITYLPRYLPAGDPEFEQSDEQFRQRFLQGLSYMLPDFDPAGIVSTHVHRAAKVQPLQVIDYSKRVPTVKTAHSSLYVVNTSQFVNATLNNNEVVRAVEQFVRQHRPDTDASDPALLPDRPMATSS